MSAAMPSSSCNITRRRGGGKTLKDLKRIKASQQRRQTEDDDLVGFVAVLLGLGLGYVVWYDNDIHFMI